MKFKDYIVPLILMIITMWTIQYFFSPSDNGAGNSVVKPGQGFTVPLSQDEMTRPLNVEIDFYDKEKKIPVQETVLAGHDSQWVFSTDGAALADLVFDRELAGKPGTITTITQPEGPAREQQAFLVALDEMTPFTYEVVSQEKTDTFSSIIYRAQTPQARITKQYMIDLKTYKMDLILSIEPLGQLAQTGVRPRIFFPGPYIDQLSDREVINGVVYSDRGRLKKIARKSKDVEIGVWAAPTLFGVEDRYFVNALVDDKNGFVHRAYFRTDGVDRLTAILEGPELSEKQSWHLSFYCGPKEAHAMGMVDARLESTLEYGWLAPLAKGMMYLLNFIYSYVKNYGWAIIILTLLMRLIMLPFVRDPQQDKKKRAEMDRKIKYLEEKYRDDRETLAREKMAAMKKYGMVPGAAGCLPMLLQIPFFLGLNYALRTSIELYKAPFLWISDLSAKDPYYVLPVLVGLTLIIQTSKSNDPKQRLAMFLLGLVFAGLTANFSAGLALFIAVSSLMGIVQQKVAALRSR